MIESIMEFSDLSHKGEELRPDE